MGGILIVVFPLLATLVYLPSFSEELKNRFIVYSRSRISIGKFLFIKFMANGVLTFIVFFAFTFSMFILSYYFLPSNGLVVLQPEAYGFTESTAIIDSYSRHTFTQLLEYGPLPYILVYSSWVGINAALYASIGFLLLLLINNKYVAMSVPTIIYFVGSFILVKPNLRPFRLADTIFPYMYTQQPIWTVFVPFIILSSLCVILFSIIRKNFHSLDNLK